MSGIITSGNFPKLAVGMIDKLFGESYKQLPKVYEKVFTMLNSDKAYEEALELVGVGMASVKGEGQAIAFDTMRQGLVQRATHTVYGKGMILTKEAVEDNLYRSHIARMAPELSKSIRHAEETVAANLLNNAFSTSYTFADGQPLCDTDKVISAGGTYANKPATAVDISELAFEDAILAIEGFLGSDGLRIDVESTDLIIPKNLKFDAHRILKSTSQSGNANNDTNALKDMGMLQNIIEWRFLTDTDAWFIKTNVPGGMIFYRRRAPAVTTDNEFTTDNMLFKATSRFSVTSHDQRGIFGCPGA